MVNKNRIHIYLSTDGMNKLDKLNEILGVSKSKILELSVQSLYENKDLFVGVEKILNKVIKDGR